MEHAETNSTETAAEVVIDKWVYGGAGLGRWNGQVVLAPFTLPGERISFEVGRKHKDLLNIRVKERLTSAAERIDPFCPYFGNCGGCHYQQAPQDFQLEGKRQILAETLQRVGKIQAPDRIETIAGEPWGYRNRSQFHFKGKQVGFLAAGSHNLVEVEKCPISSPKINEVLSTIRRMTKDRRWPEFIRSIELFTNETETLVNIVDTEGGKRVARGFFDWCAAGIRGGSAGELTYTVGSDKFRVSHGAFFQVNRFLVEALVTAALEGAEGDSAFDLYAGVGLFSIPLAGRVSQVSAVESSAAAVRDLEANAKTNGVTIQAHRGNSESFLAARSESADFVLADPPRTGLGPAVVGHLLRLKPRRLNIVSCDPATLARDLATLLGGGYRLEKLTLVDLFPQTFHIESVALLVSD